MIRKLKRGKAAGVGQIVSEIIKYGGEQVSKVIWLLCTKCWKLEKVPVEWMKGIIFPIYKEGDSRDPNNHRGISLLSIVAKLYASVLNCRLSAWCENNGIILEEQGGFRPGRGCEGVCR